jgi:hypothetical protein
MQTFAFICLFVGAFFAGIGIYALKTKKPMRFWSGSESISEEITDVNEQPQAALHERAPDIEGVLRRARRFAEYELRDELGQEHEQTDRKQYAEHHTDAHDGVHYVYVKLICQPFFKFRGLFIVVVGHLLVGGLAQAFVAVDHRGDEVEYPAHERRFSVPGSTVFAADIPFVDIYRTVGQTASHRHFLRSPHHNALNDRLTADLRLKSATVVRIAFRH